MEIHFFKEKVSFRLHKRKTLIASIAQVAAEHSFQVIALNYVFCTDEHLLDINKRYLNHHYYTDIITFDQSSEPQTIEGDLFISIDRVSENAALEKVPFQKELQRVIFHGLLHLLGYKDKTASEKKRMREKEDACLSLLETKRST